MKNTNIAEAAIAFLSQKADVEVVRIDKVTGVVLAWVNMGEGRYAAMTVVEEGRLASLVLLPDDFLSFQIMPDVPEGTLLVTVTKEEIEQTTADIFADLKQFLPQGGAA